eukprot:g66721.t1
MINNNMIPGPGPGRGGGAVRKISDSDVTVTVTLQESLSAKFAFAATCDRKARLAETAGASLQKAQRLQVQANLAFLSRVHVVYKNASKSY